MFLIRFFFAAFVTLAVTVAATAQQKTPIDDSVVRESETFENTLQATWPTKGKDAKAWKAEGVKASAASDHRSATGYFASSALLDKKNGDTWLQLAREYLAIETDKYSEKSTFARNAGSSAYIAYTRSQTPEAKADALGVLAESLGARDQWRPALRIYKMSLGLVADPDVQEAYDRAFNEHGFRMLDYTADNEFERAAPLRAVLGDSGEGPYRFHELRHREQREARFRARAGLAALRRRSSARQTLRG